MPCLSRTFMATSALVFLAPAAWAEITAEDVWSDWQSYIKSFGYTVQGQEQRAGDQLVISGVTMEMQADNSAGASISMDQVIMTERSDGTVSIDLPAIMPMTFASPDAQGVTTRVSMDYRQTGLQIVASGDVDALLYTYAAAAITLETTGFEVNGEVLPPEQTTIEVTFQDLSGTSTSTRGEVYTYTQNLDVASLRYALNAIDPATMNRSAVSGQTQDLSFSGRTELPFAAGEPGDMNAMLAYGLMGEGAFSYAANAATVEIATPAGTSDAAVLSGPGSLAVSMAENGLIYDIRQNDTQMEISGSQIPLPLNFSIVQSAFNLLLPVRKSDVPEDFALAVSLNGFAMSDALWGLFDPAAQLPRDPATIVLDLAGKAKLLFDFLDPSDAVNLAPGTAPAEIETVDIKQLQVTAVGAELKGSGAFAFDNSQAGPPKPQGSVDLTLTGGNALIDRLVTAGLLPEQQAMGARMMMGLLAVPGQNPDTLNSKIEINAEGHILANGQRIQ